MSGGIERIGWAVRLEDGSWSTGDGFDGEHPVILDEPDVDSDVARWAGAQVAAREVVIYAAPEGYVESLEAERDQLKAREEHFASVLGVADGGRYRNDWDARITAVLAERDELRATVERYREALKEIDSQRENCVFSASREHENGNETFMEGSNTAFLQCSDIARRALNPEEEA